MRMPIASPRRPNTPLFFALLIGLAYHLGLLFFTFKRTYDAYVHIFFADHYARSWFEPWEPRWYTGFNMTSYPPASHQATALLSYLLGLQNGFIVVLTVAILMLIVGIYRYSKLWTSREAAGYAALITVFAASISETAHVFGQLPTLFSLSFLLNGIPYIYRWVRFGKWRILLVAWMVCAATTAGHHVTTLFGGVFFIGPVLILALLDRYSNFIAQHLPESTDHTPYWRQLITYFWVRIKSALFDSPIRNAVLRAVLFGIGLVAILIIVVLPYWMWSVSDPITQVSIPHASRDSFLVNLAAGLVFWIVPYGISLFFIPFVARRLATPRRWPLLLSFLLLVLLGTGGTTPIPRMMLGGAFDILTLDRFTFWASIVMLPFMGEFVAELINGEIGRNWRWFTPSIRKAAVFAFATGLILFSVFTVNLTQFRKFQPEPIQMQPILTFLKKDNHDAWRFMTLGFGDQMAWLSAQTDALSVEGNYHSARRLPELTTSPIERLDGAKFSGIPGLGSLHQFLTIPEKYHLKFIFSNDPFYDPLLYFSGWREIGSLENDIMIWERIGIPSLPRELPANQLPEWQRTLWGVLPLTTIALAAILVVTLGNDKTRPRWWSWQWSVIIVGGMMAAVLLWAAVREIRQNGLSAESTVLAYYDALDFREFEDAYALLDPTKRPDYKTYLKQMTSIGGLIGSYAKLNNLRTTIVDDVDGLGDDVQQIRAEAEWVTALSVMVSEETVTVNRVGPRWFIEPPPSAERIIPPEPPGISLETISSRAVRRDEEQNDDQDNETLYIVGEIKNTSGRIVDATIRAVLFDENEDEIAWNNAQTMVVHTLFPDQHTPFRIDFDQSITQTIASYDLRLFGYPTADQPYEIELSPQWELTTQSANSLTGTIANSGCLDVSIQQLLVAQRDASGEVAWVDAIYLQTPIRAGSSAAVTVAVEPFISEPVWWVTGQSFMGTQRPNC